MVLSVLIHCPSCCLVMALSILLLLSIVLVMMVLAV